MSRTTVDIDDPVLRELKRLQKREKKSLGRLISDLLTEALSSRKRGMVSEDVGIEWISKPMDARVDLKDRDALWNALDSADEPGAS